MSVVKARNLNGQKPFQVDICEGVKKVKEGKGGQETSAKALNEDHERTHSQVRQRHWGCLESTAMLKDI